MPLYVYEDADGRTVELFRRVQDRDQCPAGLRRVTACRTATIIPGAVLDPTSADAAVPAAFKKLEQTMPVDQIERVTGFKREKIKQTWDIK